MDSRRRLCALILSAPVLALTLPGCGAPGATAPQPVATAEASIAPDTVELTFELDGSSHTVVGSVGGGLRSCENGFVTVTTKAFPDAGVQLGLNGDSTRANVAAWAVGDYAVQFLGDGDIERADGDARFRGLRVSGMATVRAVEAGTTPRLNDLDMPRGKRVEATAAFSVDCPPR